MRHRPPEHGAGAHCTTSSLLSYADVVASGSRPPASRPLHPNATPVVHDCHRPIAAVERPQHALIATDHHAAAVFWYHTLACPVGPSVAVRITHVLTSHHIASCHNTSHHIVSHRITSCHIASHHATSYHITSYHIPSHRITSHRIPSYHIPSHHITSQRLDVVTCYRIHRIVS